MHRLGLVAAPRHPLRLRLALRLLRLLTPSKLVLIPHILAVVTPLTAMLLLLMVRWPPIPPSPPTVSTGTPMVIAIYFEHKTISKNEYFQKRF